jgi:predicted RNase H-like HicB family nuclease
MNEIKYVIWQEEKFYVARCLNVEVSTFGESVEEAIDNLKEAVELYFENESMEIPKIERVFLGSEKINV